MKIHLLNPPFFANFGRSARWQDTGRGGTRYYPIWLSYASAVLNQNYDIRLTDAPTRGWDTKETINEVVSYSPDFAVLDSSFPSLNNDICFGKLIKEKLDIKVVMVGPPASQMAEYILKNGIDFVARYEYDLTLNELVQALDSDIPPEKVLGISFLDNNGKMIDTQDRSLTTSKELDKIPFVSKIYKNYLDIKDYFLGQSLYPEVQIFTGRGCPNNCTFCLWPQTLMGRKYRVRSISNVLDEVSWIQENLHVKEIFFEDDTFSINKNRVLQLCKEYRERDLDIAWSCNARADTLDLETMKEMKKANCRLLIVGWESGSNKILKNIKKGIDIDQIKNFSRNAKKARLLVHGDIVVGLTGETKDTIEESKKLVSEIKPDILQVSVASPYPGTEFYNWCVDKNFLISEDPNEYLDKFGHQKSIVSYPWLSAADITEAVDEILRNYYLSPSYIPQVLNQIIRRNSIDETKRILYSAKMFLRYIIQRDRK